MKKILYLILLFLTIIGLIGGFGYTIYSKTYVISIGLIATGYIAWPGIKDLYKKLTD